MKKTMKNICVMSLLALPLFLASCGGDNGASSSNQASSSSSYVSSQESSSSSSSSESISSSSVVNKNALTLTSNIEGGSLVGAGEYEPGEKVSVIAQTNIGYSFLGWYLGDTLLSEEESYEYTMPEEDVSLTAHFEKWVAGEVVSYGKYPQECLNDPNDESSTLPEGIENATDSDSDGYIEYEGKEYLKVAGSGLETEYADETGSSTTKASYDPSTTYYFEVSPIKWKLMNDGLLLSENIIDASTFYPSQEMRTIGETSINPNNYEYSSIRAYLNGYDGSSYEVNDYSGKGFIDVAFDEYQKENIPVASIDNSAATTHLATNEFACEDTEDKIFLLSYQDCLNSEYGFKTNRQPDTARRKLYTDYAIYKGLGYAYTSTGAGEWWMRSPGGLGSISADLVVPGGRLSYAEAVDTRAGIAPAMKITL